MNNEDLIQTIKDPKRYLEAFCKIKSKSDGLVPFKLNEAQKDIFNVMRKNNRVVILKARQLGFCLDKDTKILSDDLKWITVGDIKPGQKIICVDEKTPKGRGFSRKMKLGIVEKKWTVYEEAFKLTFENGEHVIATGEHRFLAKKTEKSCDVVWKKVKDMHVGEPIRSITKTWGEKSYEDGWFSGMIDGEGSLAKKSRTGGSLCISQTEGDVWERLNKYVKDNNINYRVEWDNRKAGTSSKLGNKPVGKIVISQMSDMFHVIGKTRPSRMIEKKWWDGKRLPDGGWTKIISIESLGEREMFDIQTSEKTFIANGLVSHNSSGITGFMYHKTITVPGTTTVLIGYNTDLAAEFLDKVKTFYRTTPDALKPKIQYNSKYEISFPAIDSKIIVLPSTDNVGRGYTINNCLGEDTLLFKENGEPCKIKNIQKGDRIVNGNGGISSVVDISSKKPNNRVFDISVWHGDTLTATEDHKILCRGTKNDSFKPMWKIASDVVAGDYIAFPYRQIRDRVKSLKLPTVDECNIKRITKATFIPDKKNIIVDKKLGEFFGWYLAEGSSFNSGVTLSVDKDEVEYLIDLIKEVFAGLYSSIRVDRSEDSRSVNIIINGTILAEFIKKHIPGRSWEKTIPNYMWYWGPRFNEGLLLGLFNGDGHFSKDKNVISLTTVSAKLAYQVRLLLVSLRVGLASVHVSETSRYDVKTRDRYTVCLTGKENWKFRHKFGIENHGPRNGRERFKQTLSKNIALGRSYSRRGKTHYWMRVRSKKETKVDVVYDISLDSKPFSFLTNSGVVHNCLVSELAFWDKPEEKMLALESAVPKSGLIVAESTPNGLGNLYHRMWMAEDNGYIKKEYGWWWLYTEEEIDEIRRRINDPMRFAQEYGLEFLSTGRPVFSTQMVKRLALKNVLKVGDIVKNEDGTTHTVYVTEDGLRVYRAPRPGRTYVLGADVAEGVTGGDFSTVTILDRETGEEVAMYRGHTAPELFGALINRWGRMFNNALAVVEINNHGLTTLTALKNLMYPQMYFRPAKFDTMGSPSSERIGWKTSKLTRPLMIDDLNEALREDLVIIHSKETYDEMFTFVYDDAGNMVTSPGFHDDLLFSTAIANQGFKVMYKGTLDQIDYTQHLPNGFSY